MHEENKKSPWKREDNALLIELLQLSPPIGIKARKLKQAENVLKFDQDLIEEKSILDIENPVYEAGALATEALTNVPLARLHTKTENLQQAFNAENEWWQRLAMALGWSQWNLGITDKEVEAHKEKVKKNKKSKKKSKAVFNY
jgi:hypothetical protein